MDNSYFRSVLAVLYAKATLLDNRIQEATDLLAEIRHEINEAEEKLDNDTGPF